MQKSLDDFVLGMQMTFFKYIFWKTGHEIAIASYGLVRFSPMHQIAEEFDMDSLQSPTKSLHYKDIV